MQNVFYVLSHEDGTDLQYITVFAHGHRPESADSTHPNFDRILEAARDPEADESVLDLFDVSASAAQHFEQLSERIAVANGHIYLDGDEVANALTKQVVRFLNEGVDDWAPLVAFFEKVQANPEAHSREQLYEWLDRHEFAITEFGDFIAYKGVATNADGTYKSIHSGPGIVDGKPMNGQLPNNPGSTVAIARSLVHHDPATGCSAGLHVGTYDFAKSFSRGAVLKVVVNPRDVVSVPTDSNAQKVRVCRYHILNVTDAPVAAALDDEPDDWDFDED